MRKVPGRIACLLKDNKGSMVPLTVAVTMCLLLVILGITEYMRLMITAAGVKDALQSAVISTVNDNYNEVYHCVREGYAAGYVPDDGSFMGATDYGSIYSRLCFLLGLMEDGDGYVRLTESGEKEYRISDLSVRVPNAGFQASGGIYYAEAKIALEVPVRFAGRLITHMTLNIRAKAAYQEKF